MKEEEHILKRIKRDSKRLFYGEEGSALITVLLILIIMSMLGFYYMMISTSQQMISRNRIDDSITFLAADAGVAYAITNLAFNESWEQIHTRNDPDGTGGYIMRSDPGGFSKAPYQVWDEETVPLPDGSYAYVRTWVEYDSHQEAGCPGNTCTDMYIMSQANFGTATKIIEAQYYFPLEIFNFAY